MLVKFGCLPAISPLPDGCSARASFSRFRKTRPCSNCSGRRTGETGESTFQLPDLRGRIPLHQGNGFILAETGGVEEITLTVSQIPGHAHPLLCSSGLANDSNPGGRVHGEQIALSAYQTAGPTAPMGAASIGAVGGSLPHTNFQPYLCVDFIISLFGIFPSPT